MLAALLQKPAVGLVAPTPQREEPTKKAAESRPKDGRRPTDEEADVVEAPPGVKRRIQFVALDGVTKALVPRWQVLRNMAVVLWNKARRRTTRNDAVLPTEEERRGEGRVWCCMEGGESGGADEGRKVRTFCCCWLLLAAATTTRPPSCSSCLCGCVHVCVRSGVSLCGGHSSIDFHHRPPADFHKYVSAFFVLFCSRTRCDAHKTLRTYTTQTGARHHYQANMWIISALSSSLSRFWNASPTDFLLLSGTLQVLFTTLLGCLMLIPHQVWGNDSAFAVRLRSRDVTMAHVDWVMLALVQFAAAYAMSLKSPEQAFIVSRCLVFNGWIAPAVYLAKAWGINGFRLDGKRGVDTLLGLAGLVGVIAFTYGWAQIVLAWWF